MSDLGSGKGDRRKEKREPLSDGTFARVIVRDVHFKTITASPNERPGPVDRRVAASKRKLVDWMLDVGAEGSAARLAAVEILAALRKPAPCPTCPPPQATEPGDGFEEALNDFAVHQFTRGRTLTPAEQATRYEEGHPLRQRVLAAHREAIAGERERCAELAENHEHVKGWETGEKLCICLEDIAAAIRAQR